MRVQEETSSLTMVQPHRPLFFERWLHDTRHHMMCATSSTAPSTTDTAAITILALDTIGLFDDGTTVVFQALRVHPAARGQRVASRLSAYLASYVKEQFPKVQRLRAVIQHHNPGSIKLHAKQGYKELHREAFGMAAIDAQAHSTFHAGGAERPLRLFEGKRMDMVSKEVFWQHLSALSEDDKRRLLPGNMILSDWMPYEATWSNLQVMEREEGGFWDNNSGNACSVALTSPVYVPHLSVYTGMMFWVVVDDSDDSQAMAGFVVSQRSERCRYAHLGLCLLASLYCCLSPSASLSPPLSLSLPLPLWITDRLIGRSGTHLFNCLRCDGNAALAQWMASMVCYYLHHGCSHLCLSYDQSLRDVMQPDEMAPDFRPVPWLASLQAQLPYLDFAADYVGGSQTVHELAL